MPDLANRCEDQTALKQHPQEPQVPGVERAFGRRRRQPVRLVPRPRDQAERQHRKRPHHNHRGSDTNRALFQGPRHTTLADYHPAEETCQDQENRHTEQVNNRDRGHRVRPVLLIHDHPRHIRSKRHQRMQHDTEQQRPRAQSIKAVQSTRTTTHRTSPPLMAARGTATDSNRACTPLGLIAPWPPFLSEDAPPTR